MDQNPRKYIDNRGFQKQKITVEIHAKLKYQEPGMLWFYSDDVDEVKLKE